MGMITLEEGIFLHTWVDNQGRERVTPTIWIQYGNGEGKRIRESTGLSICKKGQFVPTPQEIRSQTFEPSGSAIRKARHERELKIKAAKDGELPEPEARKVRYDELASDLEDELKANGRAGNLKRFGYARKHLDSFFAGMRARRMTYNRMLKYRQEQTDAGRANGSINRELQYLRQMLRLGYRRGKVVKLPDFEGLLLKEPKPRDQYLELAEFKLLVSKAEGMFPYLVGFLEVLYWTGWRWKKTVRHLRWEHIREGWLHARGERNKNGEPIRVWLGDGPLGEAVARQRQYVRAVQKRTGKVVPWLFCYPDGRQLRFPTDAFKSAAKAAGFREPCGECDKCKQEDPDHCKNLLTLHDFCRSTWQVMVDAGVPEKDIMEHVGRKTRSIADRYNITSRRRLQNVGQKLAVHEGEVEAASDKVSGLQ